MKALHGQSVLVLGLGLSGLAMARWCARQGWGVHVWDSREAPPHAATLKAELPEARFFSGPLAREHLEDIQRVLKSPGLAPHDERIAPVMQEARFHNIPVQEIGRAHV